jgi:hypothetical protein
MLRSLMRIALLPLLLASLVGCGSDAARGQPKMVKTPPGAENAKEAANQKATPID